MSEMIERAAKAAYETRAKVYDFVFTWEQTGEARKDHYRAEVRAALKAIREPTRDMTMAACDALPCVDGVFGHAGVLSANVWRKMIDAALSQDTHSLPPLNPPADKDGAAASSGEARP